MTEIYDASKRAASHLLHVVQAQKRGRAVGMYSVCSANRHVLDTSLRHARDGGWPLLVESTCNQVNQFGGYMGMTPRQFVTHLRSLVDQTRFQSERLLIGGDHLGPGPWQDEPAGSAMEKACTLVHDCVAAGYQKVHLDASMRLGDDPPAQGLGRAIAAKRAARLAVVAEETWSAQNGNPRPCYVIGTEVPIPGGAHGHESGLEVTTAADAEETISLTKDAFASHGIEHAWERVLALVVQPGVEFGSCSVSAYDRSRVGQLPFLVGHYEHLVYEAHSTDYQTPMALRELVEDHFAILKVGPGLTFAFREAVFALTMIEEALLGRREGIKLSRLREILDRAMLRNPSHWVEHYSGDAVAQAVERRYSFSDRSRYYWPVSEVQDALARLLSNLDDDAIPLPLLSQFLPEQYKRVRQGGLKPTPSAIIRDKIAGVLDDYAAACGYALD